MKTATLVLVGLLVFSSASFAVDIKEIIVDYAANTITIIRASRGNARVVVDYNARLPLADPIDTDWARDLVQDFYDEVENRNQLGPDDPDRIADPGTECSNWLPPPGNNWVNRNTVVSNVFIVYDHDPVNGDLVFGFRNCDYRHPDDGGRGPLPRDE